MTVREPEYSVQDRAQLLADLFERKRPRGSHGLPIDEVIDPANAGKFEVPPPTLDRAQEALNKAKDAYHKRYPDADMDARLWRVKKVDGE